MVSDQSSTAAQRAWQDRAQWYKDWGAAQVSFRCVCNDADPFADTAPDSHPCVDPATLGAVPSGFTITHSPTCGQGYKLQDGNCVDVDECATLPSPCGTVGCVNSEGSFHCSCPAGMAGLDVAPDLCRPCPAGTFADAALGRCNRCPSGSTAPAGTAGIEGCNCLAGHFRASGAPASASCVAPDTSVLSIPGSAAAVFVSAPALLPAAAGSLKSSLGLSGVKLEAAQLGMSTLGSAAHASLGAGLTSAPFMWGALASSESGQSCLPAVTGGADAEVAPWWVGHPSASLSGFAMSPSTAGTNALARASGIVGNGSSALLVRPEDADRDGSEVDVRTGRLPAGLGALADLDAFAMHPGPRPSTSARSGCWNASFILPPPVSERLRAGFVPMSATDSALRRAIGASKGLEAVVRSGVPLLRRQSEVPASASGLLFARPASAERQAFDGPVLAVGATPHDDGWRVAAAVAPQSTSHSLAVNGSSWHASAAVPSTLGLGLTRVFDSESGEFELAARARGSAGRSAAEAEATSSVSNTLVAAVEGGPRTSAMLTHVGALINAGSAALAPADLSSLVAAHSSEGSTDADIASAADAFGVSSRPEGPGGMPQGLPPNLTEAAVQSSGPGSRAVVLLMRVLALAPPSMGPDVGQHPRLMVPPVGQDGGAPPRSASGAAAGIASSAAAASAVRAALTAAISDVSTAGSIASMARGLLSGSSAAEASLASRLISTVAGSPPRILDPVADSVRSMPWEEARVAFAFETGSPSSVAASPSQLPTPSPSSSSLPVPCELSEVRTSNCSKSCGDGGYQYQFRRILGLPAHGGAACPEPAQLVTKTVYPSSVSSSFSACPANDPCTVARPTCGASAGACSLCPSGRRCASSGDCFAGLVCRSRASGSSVQVCLAPLPSPRPGARQRPIDETLPPLGDVVSGKSGSDVTVRQPAASDSADGVVVQVTLRFGSWAALSSPAATAAIQATLLGLVKALGLPAGATVKIDLVVQDDSGGGSSGRRLQAGGASALAVVGVDLNQTSSDDPAFGSSVSAASRLGASVAQQLGSTSGTVGAALLSAIIEADPAAAEGGVSVDADARYAVLAASDGAVVAGSEDVMSSQDGGGGGGGGGGDGDPSVLGAALGGGLGALALLLGILAVVYCWKRKPATSPVSPATSSHPELESTAASKVLAA
ncbi:hypothetical protein FNF31_06941 [Cafeteria roenbergensis]|uniref:EGF-like calcium-binding domain-containing protein n=1 Tax=Cafeteria roenbergensis TaxID=33653 RepID=A0A5A8CFN9_CAFRO|nr:hypothetical protein FNF31_06941 [Cafeteria roenbergensis]